MCNFDEKTNMRKFLISAISIYFLRRRIRDRRCCAFCHFSGTAMFFRLRFWYHARAVLDIELYACDMCICIKLLSASSFHAKYSRPSLRP
jgi:hypothetical protein